MKQDRQHALIADMLYWLIENQAQQPGLSALSERFNLSESHIQRTFQHFTGVSPKQFVKFLTKEKAKARLKAGRTVLDTSLDCGLSGPGRLHDLMISTEAITPGQARKAGTGVRISYGISRSLFGETLIGWTDLGLCFLGFCHNDKKPQAILKMKGQWPAAEYQERPGRANELAKSIFARKKEGSLRIWLHGTPFQLSVWQALLSIPPGTHRSYGEIARAVGKPEAARAVGTAIGHNPVALLIPCHRVITSAAEMGGYRWGVPTKQAIIGCEAAAQVAAQD